MQATSDSSEYCSETAEAANSFAAQNAYHDLIGLIPGTGTVQIRAQILQT